MAKFVCRDYGYDCNFIAEGTDDEVSAAFGKHSEEEHGIEYSKETLQKSVSYTHLTLPTKA